MKNLFEYKVKLKDKEFIFYSNTDIEEFLNKNNIKYARNIKDTILNVLLKEKNDLICILERQNDMLKMQHDLLYLAYKE